MSIPIGNVIFELICFTAFIVICAGLLKFRYSRKYSILILIGSIVAAACIQVAILLTASDAMSLLMTLLPITAYLPVIVAVHILAKGGFAAAVATWSLGLLVPYILNLFRQLMIRIRTWDEMPFSPLFLLVTGSLILGVLLVFAALQFCRKPFQMFAFQNKYVWIIIPAMLFLLLISYIESMTFEPFIAFITFLIVLVMFAFLVKFLNVAMSERIAKASEQEIARQLDLQRQELLRINQKMEQGRIYRHDMRHHLSVLKNLAESEKTEDIQKYIDSLNTQISNVGKEEFCENSVVNAVFSSYIEKGKHEHIPIEAKVHVPKKLPIDEFDICTVLANALDNAVTACCKCQGERWISISSTLHENGNFSADIKNPCETPLKFGKNGLPDARNSEEHGFGLKSIDAIVRKYNGILRCTCDDGIFRLSVVLFPPDNVPVAERPFGLKRVVSNTAVSLLLAICLLNFLPETIQAVANVPVIGDAIQLLDISSYRTLFSWGSSSLNIVYPQISTVVGPSSVKTDVSEESTATNSDTENSTDLALPNETVGSDSETDAPSLNEESGITLPNETESSDSEADAPSFSEGSSITLPQITEITIPEQSQPQTSLPAEPSSETETGRLEVPSVSEPENQDSENPNIPADNDQDFSNGIDEMNRQMQEYIEKVEDEFLYYFSRKYQGYVASDTGYNILRNDEKLLSIQFYTTINMGGSGEYSRCFTLDKTSGTVLKLADLFTENSDYVGVISADILRQMEEQVEAGEADYFIPGGIWSDEECFKEIEEDQNFYIDENNNLVILFEEYEVAPGSAGMPQFTIESELLLEILRQPSLLSPAEKETN